MNNIMDDLSPFSAGLIDELEAFMAPVGEGCYPQQPLDARRIGSHQLPESPPDSGSENPYSPSEVPHAITVSQTVLGSDYMLVHDHIANHEILQPEGEYIYEELKSDNLDHDVLRSNLNDVVVLPQDPNIVELGIRTVRHELGLADPYQNRYGQMRVDMPDLDQGIINPQLVALSHETLTPVYTSLQEPSTKKRKHSQDANSQVKCEPAALSPETAAHARPPPSVDGSETGDDAPLQCIRFSTFQQSSWHTLYDCNLKPIPMPSYVVGADKGFNYSQIDEAFVCQKKNHFQVTCQIQMQGDPHYVKSADGFKKITNFCLHFYGVKAEDPSQEVKVEQSQSDRTKKPFHPVPVELRREGAKLTVGRLHFAETTNNNMRKKGRPNPDQRHFQLVVALRAHVSHSDFIIAAQASDRIIVRASNPGQFESDCSENWWQRGASENTVHFNGRVGINTDRPDESCVVNGNLKVMGHILHPSDARAKRNIEELDTAQQLRNVQSIKVVKFDYEPSFLEHSGLVGYEPNSARPRRDTGVIAQDVRRVLPDAVREAGDVALPGDRNIQNFLVVNKDRIFMENLGAVKELCKVTGNLESRIDQLERINKKLCKISTLQRQDSTRSSVSNDSHYSAASNSSKSLYSDGNISIDQIRGIARNIRRHECCQKLSHNSPKYTRKQCKNCHGNSKFGKYYNYNKTCVRYHSSKDDKIENADSKFEQKTGEDNYSTMSKKKAPCIWLKEDDDFSHGNTRLPFCCKRKDYGDSNSELISNKFLQIVITVLIFIMAVCLVVMSALYFREHQELVMMRETRFQNARVSMSPYGKFHAPPRAPPDHNYIQNLKPLHAATAKKQVKEKSAHKTTPEYTTISPTELPHTVATTLLASRNYVKNLISNNIEQTSRAPLGAAVKLSRVSDVIGAGCSLSSNTDNELDADCQTSCGIDQPQSYDIQEPLERKPEKELNDTFARPPEPTAKEKQPTIPLIPERNSTEPLKSENESFKALHLDIIAESNLLDSNKQNLTENATRMKRNAQEGYSQVRVARQTNEAVGSGEEFNSSDQSDENFSKECDKVSVGISSEAVNNSSVFVERICPRVVHNHTYTLQLSHCLRHSHIELTFRSSKLKDFHRCSPECSSCRQHPTTGEWRTTAAIQSTCGHTQRIAIRTAFTVGQDLCKLTPEDNIPFAEYNILIYRDCSH